MNKALWIDFLSVRQGARKSGFLPCSKGEGIQCILGKTHLQEEKKHGRRSIYRERHGFLRGLCGAHI